MDDRGYWRPRHRVTRRLRGAGCAQTHKVSPERRPCDRDPGCGSGRATGGLWRLADAEDQGRSSQRWIDKFIEKVTADSGGAITIEPIYNAGGGNDDKPGELVVAGQVIAGDVELALVPVRAWNDAGVTSLQALEAPLLIDSDGAHGRRRRSA